MGLRMLRVQHPQINEEISDLLENIPVIDISGVDSEKWVTSEVLIPAEETDEAVEILEDKFSSYDDFRITIISVEASIPREDVEKASEEEDSEGKGKIGTDEIYQNVYESAKVSKTYLVMTVLASIVASIGILYNDIPVIVGSMVIAPLLHPNMALSLSTTLADFELGKRAAKAGLWGFLLAISVGFLFGLILAVDPSASQIVSRTDITLLYVVLALASGVAGSLSVTRGVSEALVGVMIAVALLPPLVTTGLLLGSGFLSLACGSFLLFSVNLVSINLAGVATFLVQDIKPHKWWEKEKAEKMSRKAVLIWTILLLMIAVLIEIYSSFV